MDGEHIDATLKDGLLRLTVPRHRVIEAGT
jgi:HSP20 family molecular chaperone IbpA